MSVNEELKNCPFCGDKAECTILASDDGVIDIVIRCAGCGAQITTGVSGPIDIKNATYAVKSLVNKWNTRSATTDKQFTNETTEFHYDPVTDQIELTLRSNTGTTSVIYDRTQLKTHLARCETAYKNSQKGEWWFADEGFTCSKCNYESRYMFTKCPGCKRTMKNGTEEV